MSWLIWRCSACGRREETDTDTLARRLQGAGLLKRSSSEERGDTAYLLALASSVADRLACPACGAANYGVQSGEGEGFATDRACDACSRPIPAERLELFPEATLCAACQAAVDQGQSFATGEYCPRCAAPLLVRAASGAGVTRYALVCPQCRR